MGRKRGKFICPRCQRQGSLRKKWTRNPEYPTIKNYYRYVEHYDSISKKTKTCYVEKLIRQMELKEIVDSPHPDLSSILDTCRRMLDEIVKRYNRWFRRIGESGIDAKDKTMISSALDEGLKEELAFVEQGLVYVSFSLKQKLTSQEKEKLGKAKKYMNLLIEIRRQLRNMDALKKDKKILFSYEEKLKIFEENKLAFQFLNRPYQKALIYYYEKYEENDDIRKKKALKEKLSESAFGSSKYSGTVLQDIIKESFKR